MTAEELFELKEPHFTKLAKDEFGKFNARYVIEFAEAYAKQENNERLCNNLDLIDENIELKAEVDRLKDLLIEINNDVALPVDLMNKVNELLNTKK